MEAMKTWARRMLVDPWQEADFEADRQRSSAFDWRPAVILTTTAVVLAVMEYFGNDSTFSRLIPYDPNLHDREQWDLWARVWWAGIRVLAYVVIPCATVLLMPGERLRDYYLSAQGLRGHLWIYAVLCVLVVPFIAFAASRPEFLATYPFYRYANQSLLHFIVWELLYALQFIALEFFFRGYMLKGLSGRFGSGAIFVMLVPYCMIHFSKPMPEALGSIVAGVVLGTLAMRTRSMWGGAAIHVAVALTMDGLAVAQCPPPGVGPCR